jgi:hypothetical protein
MTNTAYIVINGKPVECPVTYEQKDIAGDGNYIIPFPIERICVVSVGDFRPHVLEAYREDLTTCEKLIAELEGTSK